MLKSSLCDYSDVYILVKGTTTIPNTTAAGTAANNVNKKATTKNYAPYTDYISELNNTQVNNAKYIDVAMSIYNLIEHSDNYSKTSGSLWQYYRDEPALNNAGSSIDFPDDNNSVLFKSKQKIIGQTGNELPLKYLSNFWRTLEMPLINCEINLFLTWPENFFIMLTVKCQHLQ